MTQQKRKNRDGTRAARFLIIRDAVLAHSHRMQQIHAGMYEIGAAPSLFTTVFQVCGAPAVRSI